MVPINRNRLNDDSAEGDDPFDIENEVRPKQ